MDVNLRRWRLFLAVADELHFGRAAEVLGVAQPALSQQVRRLEAELGVELFRRTSRSVALTPAGQTLRHRAEVLLAQAERDVDEVRRVGRGEQGRLDLGLVSSVAPLGTATLVRRFRRRHPGVQVRVHEGFTADLLERLVRGGLDVAVLRDPEEHPSVRRSRLTSEPFVAVLPDGHRLARAGSVSGADLAGEPFVFFPRAAGAAAYAVNLEPVTVDGRAPTVVQEASSWATILHLVAAGLGVTVAPRSAAAHPPDLVAVLPLTRTDARSTTWLAARVDDVRPVVRDFLEGDRASGSSPAG